MEEGGAGEENREASAEYLIVGLVGRLCAVSSRLRSSNLGNTRVGGLRTNGVVGFEWGVRPEVTYSIGLEGL